MDKLKMAHEWAMACLKSGLTASMEELIIESWKYADVMQAEADKRNKAEAAQKRKEIREMLNAPNTFIEREGQHFDDVEEWQPDWSQAPSDFKWFFKQQDGSCHFSSGEPEFLGDAWAIDAVAYAFESPISCPVDWEDSLRERPHGF